MKDPDYLRIADNNRAASTVLSSSNIALPDGLYVIPAEPLKQQRQPDELLTQYALLSLALALMLLALFQMA